MVVLCSARGVATEGLRPGWVEPLIVSCEKCLLCWVVSWCSAQLREVASEGLRPVLGGFKITFVQRSPVGWLCCGPLGKPPRKGSAVGLKEHLFVGMRFVQHWRAPCSLARGGWMGQGKAGDGQVILEKVERTCRFRTRNLH